MRIGLLTGGGDAPGLNAVIRAVVKAAASRSIETIGIEDGFAGLIEPGRSRPLSLRDMPGILRRGGTILGTTNRRNPLAYAVPAGGVVDHSARCVQTFHDLGLDALVVVGGDGTLAIANEFHQRGIPLVAVPKTIDNDIVETDCTFGFDSAVGFATDAIDRLHTSAESHHRIMVVEVMGRYTGWIALHAGIAGGADIIVIPEDPVPPRTPGAADPGARAAGRALQHRGRGGRCAARRGERDRAGDRIRRGGRAARRDRRAARGGSRNRDRQGSPQRAARAPAAGWSSHQR